MKNKDTFPEDQGAHIEREQEEEPAVGAEGAPEELQSSEPAKVETMGMTPEEVAKIAQEKEEYYDRLLRTQADFDNYRKRIQKEQASLIKYGAENVLREILPVVDNLERAVDSARKHGDSNFQLREGIELVLAQLRETLGRLGVKPVESVGAPFDPNKHDALIRVHAPDAPEGVVVDEIRKGYYLHDKVLRPAQVTVGTHEQVGDS
ncbi:MAG: nucleotide exchange factor GrpE [Candidatus Abyssobacteria bacterium SURF_5]|uniref:Protein GrpE n=1 Tax=Abyssobacteria bacterium (strain SURF_5) TaxID=2093360 RepID=A0A3A4NZH9_ABYX5|nr:MAG: nucleotide exchange factor GrpE [Candidatus Abyssubacteria bacterium SURF_5]